MQSLDKKRWDAVQVDSFADVMPGKDIYASERVDGERPYVTAGTANNGIGYFVDNDNNSVDSHVISVNRNGAVGEAFFHPYKALFSDDCRRLKVRESVADDAQQFMAVAIKEQKGAFSYSRKLGTGRLQRLCVMLPATDSGEPDYAYMAEYAQQKRDTILTKYRTYVEARIAELGEVAEIPALDEKEWKPFPIVDLFSSIIPGKGKGLNHLKKVCADGVNYIGATNRNNGVLCYVEKDTYSRPMILEGNCIGFIKNGDGSAGFAIYKAEQFISTSDVLYGYADWLNKFTGLFFVVAQDKIEHKYSHGYKRNKEHLAGDKVMLPVTNSGEPDYEYMEQYSKNMMLRKYQQYLTFLQQRSDAR